MNNKKNKLIGIFSIVLIGMLNFTACSDTPETTTTDTSVPIEIETITHVIDEVDVIDETHVTSEIDVIDETEIIQAEDYGAKGAATKVDFTLEEMMQYALEDEYLAYAEYELIINEMDITRPFSNIIKAESTHIGFMEDLYEAYGYELPIIDPSQHITLPESINDAFIAGVDAEIINIAMYENFLAQDLPDDVRRIFEKLKAGSESHLKAFQKNVR